jgi:hypothetical protein
MSPFMSKLIEMESKAKNYRYQAAMERSAELAKRVQMPVPKPVDTLAK